MHLSLFILWYKVEASKCSQRGGVREMCCRSLLPVSSVTSSLFTMEPDYKSKESYGTQTFGPWWLKELCMKWWHVSFWRLPFTPTSLGWKWMTQEGLILLQGSRLRRFDRYQHHEAQPWTTLNFLWYILTLFHLMHELINKLEEARIVSTRFLKPKGLYV